MNFEIVILLIIAFLVGYFIWNSMKKKRMYPEANVSKPYPKDELRIENVGPGGVIHLVHIGAEMEEFDVDIVARHLYRSGDYEWHEIEAESARGKVWIEMEEDDGLQLSITLKKLKLKDIGISKSELEEFRRNDEGEITYQNETYYFEESDRATFYHSGALNAGEEFEYWDFENNDGNKFISIEKWSDDSVDVSYSESVKDHQITVFSLGSQSKD